MSEYDAGWSPPRCPECKKWETVRYTTCKCMMSGVPPLACSSCGGSGGWFTCSCGFTDKPEAPRAEPSL